MQQVNGDTVKMKAENETGMVSPPKGASKYILQVRDERSGALMVGLPINQDDLDFLNLLVDERVFTGSVARKAMISSVVRNESSVEQDALACKHPVFGCEDCPDWSRCKKEKVRY